MANKGDSSGIATSASFRGATVGDIVGVELGSNDPRGCPAVRLERRHGTVSVRAVGFVPPPPRPLPSSWADLTHQPVWAFPRAFAAPCAAIAVSAVDQVVRQTTMETARERAMTGEPESADESGPAKASEPVVIERGVPYASHGYRFVVESLDDEEFVLKAGLKEYQVLWLSRLLPEGRRPTAYSVQASKAAMVSALVGQPAFAAADGNAAALYMTADSLYFVGYRSGRPAMFRELPGTGGFVRMQAAFKAAFGEDEKVLDELLGDSLVDASSVLEPLVRPALKQVDLSLGYLKSRLGVEVRELFLMGVPAGAAHWCRLAETSLKQKLVVPSLFEGLAVRKKLSETVLRQSQVFLNAYGAARAALEEA